MTDNPTALQERRPMLGFGQLVEQAWTRYNQEFRLLMSISVVVAAYQMLLQFIPASFAEKFYSATNAGHLSIASWVTFAAIVFVGLIASTWGSLALLFAIARPGEATSWAIAFRRGGGYFWGYLTTGFLLGIILLIGFVLLVIPGLYLAGLFGLAGYLVFKENIRNVAALRRSAALIKGYWWSYFGRQVLFVILLGFGLSLLTASMNQLASHFPGNWSLIISGTLNSIIFILIMPMASLFQATIYDNLAVLHSSNTASSTPDTKA